MKSANTEKVVDLFSKAMSVRGGLGPHMYSIVDETELMKLIVVNQRSYEVPVDVFKAIQGKAWNLYPQNKPEKDKPVWYFFAPVGVHYGKFDGHDTFVGSHSRVSDNVISHWMYAPEIPR